MKKLTLGAISLLALFSLWACPSFSTMQTVRTVPEGEIRGAVSAHWLGIGDVGIPQFELGLRYGLTDSLDLGAKLYSVGAEIGMKYQAVRGAFDLSIAPAVSYFGISTDDTNDEGVKSSASVHLIYMHLPLLMGYNVSESITLGFGPKFLYILAFGSGNFSDDEDSVSASASGDGMMGGAFVSVIFKIGKAFWIGPEINIYTNLTGNADAFANVFYQGGIALYLGGPDKE